MKVEVPSDIVAVAIDYKGDARNITAVRYIPSENRIIPQFQLNANPSSKDFGRWAQVGMFRTDVNAQHFIASKTKTAARIWFVTNTKRFIEIWDRNMGVRLNPEDIQLARVEEAKDEDQAG